MSTLNVQILSGVAVPFVVEFFTLDKSFLSAVNVGNLLPVSVICIVISFLTGKCPYVCSKCGKWFLCISNLLS